jgi:hypothetical protein
VTPYRAGFDGRPNRILMRGLPYGGWPRSEKAVPRGKDGKPFEYGPDEGLLMGARNVSPVNGGGDWIVTKPDHWMFEGTGMKKGDRIPGLVGWEYHGNPAQIPGLEVVAEGTAWRSGDTAQHWTATVYPGPRKNFVFNSATIFWAQALSSLRATCCPGPTGTGRTGRTSACSGWREICSSGGAGIAAVRARPLGVPNGTAAFQPPRTGWRKLGRLESRPSLSTAGRRFSRQSPSAAPGSRGSRLPAGE